MSADRFEQWLATLPADAQAVIRADPQINMTRAFTKSVEYITAAAQHALVGDEVKAQQAQAMSDLYYSIAIGFQNTMRR